MYGTIRIKVTDRDGRVKHDVTDPMGSVLKAFLQIFLMRLSAADVASVIDITNTEVTVDQSEATIMMRAKGNSADAGEGIVAGTGNTAVDIADYKLETLIAHGTGGGQLEYATQAYPVDVATGASSVIFQTSRILSNNSGGEIIIKETGIYAAQTTTTTNKDFCIIRDVPTEAAVANGEAATITYTFTITE